MTWHELTSFDQLNNIDVASASTYVLIYKHSTRCGICDMVKDRLERHWKESISEVIKPYLLDLLQHRDISNEIEKRYGVRHQSPQVLVIKNGKCIYSESQTAITLNNVVNAISV